MKHPGAAFSEFIAHRARQIRRNGVRCRPLFRIVNPSEKAAALGGRNLAPSQVATPSQAYEPRKSSLQSEKPGLRYLEKLNISLRMRETAKR
jgi:hypothetical protein